MTEIIGEHSFLNGQTPGQARGHTAAPPPSSVAGTARLAVG